MYVNSPNPIRVVLSLRSGLIRDGLAALLRQAQGYELLGSFGNSYDMSAACRRLRPDVTIIEVSNVRRSVYLLGSRLLIDGDSQCVVFLGNAPNKNTAPAASMATGAVYLTYNQSFSVMIDGIAAALGRDVDAASNVAHRSRPVTEAPSLKQRPDPPELSRLSQREVQVLQLLTEGKTVKECAENLCLSPSTVDNHKARLMKKLQVHKSVELVHAAIRMGVVTL